MLNKMNLDKLYSKIIPPDNYQDRKDFYNEDILDSLDEKQKTVIEEMLIKDLRTKCDLLIIESLAHLKSSESINVIENHLQESKDFHDKLIIAWCLYSLGKDREKMIDIAYESFLLIENKYTKTYLFYYLAMFKNDKINNLIKSFFNDKDFLLSSNAKSSLGIED